MAKREPKSMAEGLIQGLEQAVAHSRGKLKLKTTMREVPGPAPKWSPAQIRRLRKEVYHLSQPLFAAMLNVTTSSIRAWEQGQKVPSGAAARLLQILAADHMVIERLVA